MNGDITCNEVQVEGVASFSGDMVCTGIHVEGTCKIAGNLKSGSCWLAGLLNVGKDLEAESFTGSGSFQVGGTLNAENIDIKFVYGSGASEVCGKDITIYKEHHNAAAEFIMDLIPWRHKGKNFTCTLIEGDRIDISQVQATTVRGAKVKIGPECTIDLVEYHEAFEAHPSAKIGKTIHLGAEE
ncbi:hypothetical protein K7I13_07915 [Brucepastera parasyntrophica]|uniref:hypothetical protein n=1 Tax=Brucepastera parasyntrophica TaxID=2880008 RepID=UPI00210ABF72|nr:hypothetical protein [Brucepastera parasyntrophica]ULQ58501.1 hypothetical protein K7I13_07915 [Brucepastera parasyntrophica]